MTGKPIYLDHQATTPLAPEALQAMLPWLSGPESLGFANPHSMHRAGRAAAAAVEVAREQVASLLPRGGRVIFTSGATEALNQALRSVTRGAIAYSAIEHSAVVNAAIASGEAVHELPVSAQGLVDPEVALPDGVGLVAVMQVNNEIGTIQPVERLAERAQEAGALFLCDAVQGAGKLAPPEGADLIAITAHKLYGPKGIGALWVRDGVKIGPLIAGGGQESGLRSGTLSPALCAGFGAAAALAKARMEQDFQHLSGLAELARSVLSRWTVNGSESARWPGNLSLRLAGLNFPRLLSDCRDIAFSAGSACGSGTGAPSRVLTAIGLEPAEARNSIRLGFGRYTTHDEVETACRALEAAAQAQGV
ncbi:cysteine desulfurase family protein [Novosphingobium ginsenosidimutans]|uniref:Cysteine desulfurase n=1 Tax=Novosphingobium ginsenosidimutans TaxID=1176536 RepID=A0A5B8S6S2_9SPHN|nr:aminotransferase class V-fold PLP-dependent enzyme [Novosphingobium ginsenosidimutans]QEA17296.1 aminotransferase class V-fold PLP-dependent enzyme [Novosphingobium ginsenosidimutans]